MFSIPGYRTLEQLHSSDQSFVLRAVRERDALPVILKILRESRPTSEQLARFRHEHEALRSLDSKGVVKSHDFLRVADRWLMVQEDFGGESLARCAQSTRLDVAEVSFIGQSLAAHLAELHEHAIIHKHITPDNVVFNRGSEVVKLIDFGLCARLSRATMCFVHPSELEGTPAYLAPEQTGRLNQPVDERADLYSLGCTLYTLLSGHPPFETSELMELLHGHLARIAKPLHECSEVPRMLSDIVARLMAKNAGDRYQSARGLAADLRRWNDDWRAQRTVHFELGAADAARRPLSPTRLYGHEEAVAELVATFESAADGASQLLFLTGHAGVGKSVLAKELYGSLTRRGGFFVSAKYGGIGRHRPYAVLLTALDELCSQVLREAPARLEEWVRRLETELALELPVLAEALPRLELLVGRVAPLATRSGRANKGTFQHAIARFIEVFAPPESPLVLFIDDLQWADVASIELLAHVAITLRRAHLLLLGSYRDLEVPAGHPLRVSLDTVREHGVQVREIHLEPLDAADTALFLADALRRDRATLSELGRLIHHKTLGNPLFIQTLLDSAFARGIVSFDPGRSELTWDMPRLRSLDSNEGVVDLLLSNLRTLPPETQALLSCAACVGNQFDLDLLAAVVDQSPHHVARTLAAALYGHYLVPLSGDHRLLEQATDHPIAGLKVVYRFAHDRVQQAAYDLTPAGQHAAVHLRIGRTLRELEAARTGDVDELTCVNHLNLAGHLLDDSAERIDLSALNLTAGQRAGAAAPVAALEYFEHGLWLLERSQDLDGEPSAAPPYAEAFRTSHELALALTRGAAEAAYLAADFTRVDRCVAALLSHVRTPLERVFPVQVRINAQVARYQLPGTLDAAREILLTLGIELPTDPVEADVDAAFARVTRELAGKSPADLAMLPAMADPSAEAALRLLHSIFVPAVLTEPTLYPVVAAHMVLVSLRHGLGEYSVNGFIYYGMALCGRGHLASGNAFGQLAEQLVERHQTKSHMPDLGALGGFYIFHWKRPVRATVAAMRAGYLAGIESGALGAAANCLQGSVAMGYLAGRELRLVDDEYSEAETALERYKQGPYLTYARQYHQAVRNFRVTSAEPTVLAGDIYDQVASLPLHEQSGDQTAIYMLDFNRMLLCYHFGEYENALGCARALERGNQPGAVVLPVTALYLCLSLLATYAGVAPAQQPAIIEEVEALIERMHTWGDACEANYAHKYHLMAAELAGVRGRDAEAREHYELAAELARRHEFLQEEALALERAALFYLARGNVRLAGHYMRDAHYTYGAWGSAAKCEWLRRRHGYLFEATPAAATDAAATNGRRGSLDLDSVLEAARAIAREQDLTGLLAVIMRVSLENAGAQRGFLILVREDQLIIRVRAELTDSTRVENVCLSLADEPCIAESVVQYVARTAQLVLLDDAATEGLFTHDPHVRAQACKSILCVPIRHQGSLVAVTYLENAHTTGVFNQDRVAVLTLLMGQAAVSLENARLDAPEDVSKLRFRVGGSLPADSPVYVPRKADELLLENVRRGELSYVLNARQMGKSSMRVRAVDRLSKAGVACVSIDLTSIGTSGVTAEQWYAGISRALCAGLGLDKAFQLRSWWRDHSDLSAVQRLDVLVDEVILAQEQRPIAVFVDEVDAVLGLPFESDDFFALIRQFYNRRADDTRYSRLTFALLGVASPSDLIRDKRRTPFNVGSAVPLSGLRFEEARKLIPALADLGDGEELLRAVLDASGGQPFLTQKLCRLAVCSESRPALGREREWVAKLVRTRVVNKWRQQDEPEHLRTIDARILHFAADAPRLLEVYRRVLHAGELDASDSGDESTLLLSGLVTRDRDKLRVGNPIYAAVFDDAWVSGMLAELEHGAVKA